jgi:hypothetical protein
MVTSVLQQETETHTFGVQPIGNSYFGNGTSRSTSLGFFSMLSDEFLLELLQKTDILVIGKLARVSKYFYCFCYHDDLWREFVLARYGGEFKFVKNWRTTFKKMFRPSEFVQDCPIKCMGVYSDLLYTSWRCKTVDLIELCTMRDNIDRRSNLSLQVFKKEYASKNRPVIITDIVQTWPAFKKWNHEYFLQSKKKFRAERVDLTYSDYKAYMDQCNEEAPLYLFDKNSPIDYQDDFSIPNYFEQDFFSVLGDGRRDYRWIIIGPTRSGSTFHIDPNSTSAFNAVITGSKKWILYPPNMIPPGVYPTKDGSEVTSPVSITEWYLNYYSQLHEDPDAYKPIEAICKAGEILFVPRGWWHSVVNLEDTIALTQNFVNEENIQEVCRFLRNKPEQVSGYKGNLYTDFMESLATQYPEIFKQIQQNEQEFISKKRKWENLAKDADSGFKFNFS